MANIQICATVPSDTVEQIKQLAERDNRSISQMISILLAVGVKEKTRKRGTKDTNS